MREAKGGGSLSIWKRRSILKVRGSADIVKSEWGIRVFSPFIKRWCVGVGCVDILYGGYV